MKKLLFIVCLMLPVQSNAGWISTLVALDANNKASQAAISSQSAMDQIQVLRTQLEDLRKVVMEMAKKIDSQEIKNVQTRKNIKK